MPICVIFDSLEFLSCSVTSQMDKLQRRIILKSQTMNFLIVETRNTYYLKIHTLSNPSYFAVETSECKWLPVSMF